MVTSPLRRLIDWSVALVPEQDRRIARLLSGASLVLALAGAAWVPVAGLLLPPATAVVSAAMAFVILWIPVLLRRLRSTFWAGQLFLAVFAVGLSLNAWMVGGDGHQPFVCMPIIPAAGFMLLGRRTGIAWTLGAFGILAAAFFLNRAGLTNPLPTLPFPHQSAVDIATVMLVVGAIAGIVMVADREQRRSREEANAANRDLVLARDRALAASRAKTEFLANMSHEIRTPMNGVLGLTGLLLDTELSKDQHELARLAHRSGEILLGVVNDILDFSKVEAGQLSLEPVPFGLVEMVEDVGELLRGRASEKGIALIVRAAPGLPCCVLGDQGRLRQIVLNLAGNAIKFTDHGHVLIDVDGQMEGRDALITIRVIDTGLGIPAHKLSMIFEKFTQADSSTTRRFGGTGLGLAIVDQLVKLMGGEIEVTSTPQVGSTFLVRIKLPTSEMKAPEPQTTVAMVKGLRVLLAEDNIVNQKVAVRMLEQLGCRVDVAANGNEAVDLASRLPYDLVLMDCQMPVMDGYDATGAIRRLPAPRCAVPIIALTAHVMAEERAHCLASGMNDHLSKPLSRDALQSAIHRWEPGQRNAMPRAA